MLNRSENILWHRYKNQVKADNSSRSTDTILVDSLNDSLKNDSLNNDSFNNDSVAALVKTRSLPNQCKFQVSEYRTHLYTVL